MSRNRNNARKGLSGFALAASLLIGFQGISFTLCTPEASAFPKNGDVDDGWVKDWDVPKVKEDIPKPTQEILNKDEIKDQKRAIAQRLPMPSVKPNVVPGPGAAGPTASASAASASETGVPLLKGQVTYTVPSGTPIKLKLATVPLPQMKMDMRDEEGNLRPAQLGEIITAKTTEDIYVDDNKVIPEGTVFHGRVEKISPPRHVGRPGHLELSFDRFTTPDGKTFAFKAEANNFKESTNKSKLKGAGQIAAHAAGGAALGALVAYKFFGPEKTVAMHGYNVAGGAAIGAIGGIAWALWRRGPHAVLEPGDEFQMKIDTDMLIPAATAPTQKAPAPKIAGFQMEIVSKKTIKDGFGGHMLRVETWISNRSNKKLTSIDLFVEDDLGNRFPVSPDIEEEAQEIFHIQPMTMQKIICTFQIEYPKLKHKLVWLDHHNHSVIMEQKL